MKLARMVLVQPLELDKIRLVGGLDVAFPGSGDTCIAAAVVIDLQTMELIESKWAKRKVHFPYVPGLLSSREAPVMLAALAKLHNKPDVLLIDGQGLAHPRRCGLASHIGVQANIPTIGCAKSRLIGTHAEIGSNKGDSQPLIYENEQIGTVLRTRDKVKCLYISVGHKTQLDQAVQLTLKCCVKYRLPEPTHRAHQMVTQLRNTGQSHENYCKMLR